MLKKNDIVDIVSLGTACDSNEIKEIKNYVKKIGLIPNIFLEKETVLKKSVTHEFPSFSAEMRFEQLKKSIENPDSKIIWCSRGGYGSAEILPFLMKMKKPKTQKIFIGFSDISALNIFLIQQWGWKVVSAPMLIQLALAKVSKKSEKAILDLVFGRMEELNYKLALLAGPRNKCGVTSGKCGVTSGKFGMTSGESDFEFVTPHLLRGPVIGGCTSVISSHFGTQNQLDWNQKILFLEDEGEDGERLDRYFHQIVTIIREQKKIPIAIILGNFLEANPHGTPKAKNIKIAIKKFAEKLPLIPIFQEKTNCLGHSRDMLPLLLGAEAKIIANKFLIQKV
jgi:muramoyltetrapeptide carboxypeptidase